MAKASKISMRKKTREMAKARKISMRKKTRGMSIRRRILCEAIVRGCCRPNSSDSSRASPPLLIGPSPARKISMRKKTRGMSIRRRPNSSASNRTSPPLLIGPSPADPVPIEPPPTLSIGPPPPTLLPSLLTLAWAPSCGPRSGPEHRLVKIKKNSRVKPDLLWSTHGLFEDKNRSTQKDRKTRAAQAKCVLPPEGSDLRIRMNKEWPSLKDCRNPKFWTSECRKHGRLLEMDSTTYFKTTLDLAHLVRDPLNRTMQKVELSKSVDDFQVTQFETLIEAGLAAEKVYVRPKIRFQKIEGTTIDVLKDIQFKVQAVEDKYELISHDKPIEHTIQTFRFERSV